MRKRTVASTSSYGSTTLMNSSIEPLVGLVAIGRNEGDRLRACFESVAGKVDTVVYVDSGSTDGSVELAISKGIHVVRLDMAKPFTAARARNAGFEQIRCLLPNVEFVQLVDGDCVVDPHWLSTAVHFLHGHPRAGVVCGRRRERFPEASIYNCLCDIEWDTPIGEAKACGGDALVRARAFQEAGGFRPSLIAGEEPELCIRVRAAGWTVHRIDQEMTLHDANMTRFSQWWKRTMRGGYAFAEGAHLHGAPPERHWVQETRRALAWGLLIPFAGLGLALWFGPPALLLWLIYPLQVIRLRNLPGGWSRSFFLVLGRFPEAIGAVKFHVQRLLGRTAHLIEYK